MKSLAYRESECNLLKCPVVQRSVTSGSFATCNGSVTKHILTPIELTIDDCCTCTKKPLACRQYNLFLSRS